MPGEVEILRYGLGALDLVLSEVALPFFVGRWNVLT